jgi:hypothetical protein
VFGFFADCFLFEKMGSRLVFWFHFAISPILNLFLLFIFEVVLILLKFVIEDNVVFELAFVI